MGVGMDPFRLVTLAVFLPFLLAATVPAVEKLIKHRIGWFASLVAFISFLLIINVVPLVIQGESFKASVEWLPSMGIEYSIYVDGLSILFGIIITVIGIIIMSYSNGYMSRKEDLPRYYQWLLLFMGSMLGLVFSANTIMMFIFWELTSITSFMLIGYWRNRPESVYGATKSLLVTASGGLFMLAGFIVLRSITGTFDITTILQNDTLIKTVHSHEFFLAALVLIFIGAASKSAQGPFYIWLPNAMEAPTPVSAFLHSATMVKAGIYLVARVHPIFSGTEAWFILVSGTGIITMLVAGFLAFRQTDIKALLAYSTISQLAYIMTMYGYTTYHQPGIGVAAATFHLLNHATFKACLFLVAGIVAHEAATRDITKLGGLRHEMPVTFIIASIGALSMAGVPPFNGFLSKEMFYESSIEMGHALGSPFTFIIPALAVAGGVFTFAYSIKFITAIFFGKRPEKGIPSHIHDPSVIMILPAAFLAGLIILFGLVPSIVVQNLVEPTASSIMMETQHLHVKMWHGFTSSLMMTLVTFMLGILIYTKYESIAEWQNSFNRKYPFISVNYVYDGLVNNARNTLKRFASFMQPGPVKAYVLALLVLTIILFAIPFLKLSTDLAPTLNFNLEPYEVLVLFYMIVAAVGAAVLPKYLQAVISLSALGYLVGLLFIYLSAPDLALTQVLVETLTTIIFVLAIVKIPQTFKEHISPSQFMKDALISVAIASVVFILLLSATQGIVSPFESLSYYFIENALPLAGGHNIVNVIIVDFRGYDTLGEIAVMCLAALGVYNLIHSRGESQ
jgi:multicomponent Na+:H+ antiporter subunit A